MGSEFRVWVWVYRMLLGHQNHRVSAECHRVQAATGMITLCISSGSRGFKGLLNEVANSCDNGTPDGVGLAPKVGRQQADVAGHNMRQPAGFKVTHSETTAENEKKRLCLLASILLEA